MYKNPECFFCQELEDRTKNLIKANRIVLETKNFVAFPTQGCFQIGYLLVMPKQHFLCFGELDSESLTELDGILQKITMYVREKSGDECIVFEHGTRNLEKLTSTSIMHAHIHVIPSKKGLVPFLPDYCELRKVKGFSDLAKETDNYLFLRDVDGVNYIVKNDNYPSQFFRKIACESMGISKFWDWRENPFKENMLITLDYYAGLDQ